MKNIQTKLFALLFIAFTFLNPGYSQDSSADELKYEVNRIYPYISISKEKLMEAQTLIDLDRNYKSSWVKEYISVEILASYKGSIRKARGSNDILSQEQKDIMDMADAGTDILVKVQYLPDNTLRHNDIKEMDFTFSVNPENEAVYPGGQQQLKQYLNEKAIDKIPQGSFSNYALAAVKFTVNEEGQIIDAQVFESSKDEKIDALLLETIRTMPSWTPAEYANGIKVKQEFVLTVGNMESCVINLLNIRQE